MFQPDAKDHIQSIDQIMKHALGFSAPAIRETYVILRLLKIEIDARRLTLDEYIEYLETLPRKDGDPA